MTGLLPRLVARFAPSCEGSIAIQFAFAFVPIAGIAAMALDYSQAQRLKADMQAAIDAAVLVGARDGTDEWSQAAALYFENNVGWGSVAPTDPVFTMDEDGNVTGVVGGSMPTSLLRIIGISAIDLSVDAVASVEKLQENSCLLGLGQGQDLADDAILLNGAPNITFSQCTIRSNTSVGCDGHDSGAIASIAAGSVIGCSNPQPDASVVPDIYASLAENIVASCSGVGAGVTWTPGSVPSGVSSVNHGTYIEYHVCGDLTLSGSGYLTGSAPTIDSVIVVENGDLTLANNANINTKRVGIILTGSNEYSSSIKFPNGAGKTAALSLSPPTSGDNPWRGISLYQDPILTNQVDHDWGPGATLIVDGVVYLPNSDMTMSGNGASNVTGCTKFVSNSFRTNGSVDISFRQSEAACMSLGVDQWYEVAPFLSQ
jgi:hypothetical protein